MAGGFEVLGQAGQPSRTTTWLEIVEADPDIMVITCCGFDIERTLHDLPILKRYPSFEQLARVRSKQVYIVDGNAYFSRPGPRLVDSLEILARILQPQVSPLPVGVLAAQRLTAEDLGVEQNLLL